ncbi:MAG: carbohydrate ABC transporter permease [Clostridia bacterium]|nr:carbohydrate ABC transporter permease [Clostridia bacterium]
MKMTTDEKVFSVINTIFMLFIIFITLYPFWYVIMASFSDNSAVLTNQGLMFWPQGFNLNSYAKVLKNNMIYTGYSNTLIILLLGTVLNLIMTALGAFVLSRRNLHLKKLLMIIVVVTMYFDGGIVPLYLVVKNLGLINTRWALILPGLISTYNLVILRTAFESIPASLEESAKIDGASPFKILWSIILPLSKPTIAVLVLYYGVGYWNSWFGAMIYLKDRNLYPLQLVLREILISGTNTDMVSGADSQVQISETLKYAVIVVSTLPILCIYPFLQRFFEKGIMVGAVKE